jgi:hypothetical protein
LHFQYLMASARPVDYDYFRITAGAGSLAQRFVGHDSVKDYYMPRPFNRAKNSGVSNQPA